MIVKIDKKPAKRRRGTGAALRDQPVLIERVLQLIASGMSLSDACATDSALPSYGTFFGWITKDDGLRGKYNFALELSRDELVAHIVKKIANIEIGDEYFTKNGKRIEIKTTDKIAKANLEGRFVQWQVGRMDTRYAPKPETDGDAVFNGDPRVYIVTGGLPDFPLGELLTNEERQAELERARLPHERRDGQRVDSPLELGGAVDEKES
jgi:hypothetical protein